MDTDRIVAALSLDIPALAVAIAAFTDAEARAIEVVQAWKTSLPVVGAMRVAHGRLRRRAQRRRGYPEVAAAAQALAQVLGRTRPRSTLVALAALLRTEAGLSYGEIVRLLAALGYETPSERGRTSAKHKARMRAKRASPGIASR